MRRILVEARGAQLVEINRLRHADWMCWIHPSHSFGTEITVIVKKNNHSVGISTST
jgi:hypothetical protein